MSILAFANDAQAALFICELSGQISDGNWENAGPREHWKPWCSAEVIVDPKNLGRDFYARREKYNFTSGQLLEVVGERMLKYARLARIFGYQNVKLLENLFDLGGNWRGLPTYKDNGTSTYYSDIRKQLNEFLGKPENLEFVKRVAEDKFAYTMKDMKNDLRRMKEIIKMRRKAQEVAA